MAVFGIHCLPTDSVAVIGANNIEGTWGYRAIKKLISTRDEAKRQVYAANPTTPEIQGLTAFKSILDSIAVTWITGINIRR